MAEQDSQIDNIEIAAVESHQSNKPSPLFDLPSGEGLTLSSANTISERAFTNIILFAGTAESGKTTLLAALYLWFQKKPLAGYIFAGSRTLVGFEKRVHLARIASGSPVSSTERTMVSEYLHLRVRKRDTLAPPKDLLLCDLCGEDFREARDSSDHCRAMSIVRRADAFVVLIDGAKLTRLDARQQAKADPIALMRNFLDCEMLAETAIVDVLFTKWDLVTRHVDRIEIEAFADHVQDEMCRHFENRVGMLRFSRVAAHSIDGTLPLNFGLDQLFVSWVERRTGCARKHLRLVPLQPDAREYDRYLARRLSAISSE